MAAAHEHLAAGWCLQKASYDTRVMCTVPDWRSLMSAPAAKAAFNWAWLSARTAPKMSCPAATATNAAARMNVRSIAIGVDWLTAPRNAWTWKWKVHEIPMIRMMEIMMEIPIRWHCDCHHCALALHVDPVRSKGVHAPWSGLRTPKRGWPHGPLPYINYYQLCTTRYHLYSNYHSVRRIVNTYR